MSEETTVEITEPTEAVEATEVQTEVAETDWKAEARKWEARAKAAKADTEAAQKWRDYEKSQKPEQERVAEELAEAKANAQLASAKLLRYEVATQKGVPADAIELLTGNTQEELETAADKLLSLIASQSKQTTTKPDVNQGKPVSGSSSTADQFASALGNLL
jgi:hypothetical protein